VHQLHHAGKFRRDALRCRGPTAPSVDATTAGNAHHDPEEGPGGYGENPDLIRTDDTAEADDAEQILLGKSRLHKCQNKSRQKRPPGRPNM
jgi:hypothetical protein